MSDDENLPSVSSNYKTKKEKEYKN